MIKTQRQYNNVIRQIDSFNHIMNKMLLDCDNDTEKSQITKRVRQQVKPLVALCEQYNKMKSCDPDKIDITTLNDLFKSPINYRIASGMSIESFAKYVGVSVRQISRYESEDYQNITLSTFKRIFDNLNITVEARSLI